MCSRLQPYVQPYVLEVGCGTGLLATRLTPWLDYLGTDPAKSVVGRLQRELPRAAFEVGAAHTLRSEQHARSFPASNSPRGHPPLQKSTRLLRAAGLWCLPRSRRFPLPSTVQARAAAR